MSVVKINAITVPRERFEDFAQRFASRAGKVSSAEGFEAFELLRPNDDREVCLVVTRWRSEEDFKGWLNGPGLQGRPRAAPHGRAGRDVERAVVLRRARARGPVRSRRVARRAALALRPRGASRRPPGGRGRPSAVGAASGGRRAARRRRRRRRSSGSSTRRSARATRTSPGARCRSRFSVAAPAPLALQVDVVRDSDRPAGAAPRCCPPARRASRSASSGTGVTGGGEVAPNGGYRDPHPRAPTAACAAAARSRCAATPIRSAAAHADRGADRHVRRRAQRRAHARGLRRQRRLRDAARRRPRRARRARRLRPGALRQRRDRPRRAHAARLLVLAPASTRRGCASATACAPAQRIGSIGATGNARTIGCHLHFEIHSRGRPIDPAPELHAWDRWGVDPACGSERLPALAGGCAAALWRGHPRLSAPRSARAARSRPSAPRSAAARAGGGTARRRRRSPPAAPPRRRRTRGGARRRTRRGRSRRTCGRWGPASRRAAARRRRAHRLDDARAAPWRGERSPLATLKAIVSR